jgi:hypothetical protein
MVFLMAYLCRIRFELGTGLFKISSVMNLKSLLRLGVVTLLFVLTLLPLMAFDSHKNELSSVKTDISAAFAGAVESPAPAPTDLGPAVLTASYKGASGCAATNHEFEIAVDVLDAANNIYRVRNLLDEGQVLKAKLKDGKLQMGRQKMDSYVVTGSIEYLENPARLETHVKYEDGIGYCEDVSVFVKH